MPLFARFLSGLFFMRFFSFPSNPRFFSLCHFDLELGLRISNDLFIIKKLRIKVKAEPEKFDRFFAEKWKNSAFPGTKSEKRENAG